MASQSYKLRNPCIGILSEPGGVRRSISVREGSVVTAVDGLKSGTRMVEVEWEGRAVLFFTEDLRKHGILRTKPVPLVSPVLKGPS